MPALSTEKAVERLAAAVEKAEPSTLREIHAELFPENPASSAPAAGDMVRHIRSGIAAEEIVDLWNVVFPEDHDVHYNEETKSIHYNEQLVGSAD